MADVIDYIRDVIYNRNDPRTNDWFLISGPGPILTIIVTYIYFSVSAGPRYMRDKKPYTLKNTLIFYNFTQVLLSMYLVYEGLAAGWWNDYNFFCEPCDYSMNPKALRMARAVYLYFICKLIELLDTVFFVLRKKQRQISFLHVYHHAIMPLCGWIAVRFIPGSHATLLGVINSFIHIIMYTYYMLAAFGPHMQKYLWWKRYLTLLQIIQFSIILFQNGHTLFNPNCNFPKFLSFLLTLNAALFIYMFSSFYYNNYIKTKKQKEVDDKPSTPVTNGIAHGKSD